MPYQPGKKMGYKHAVDDALAEKVTIAVILVEVGDLNQLQARQIEKLSALKMA
jgi:hypothetical protein